MEKKTAVKKAKKAEKPLELMRKGVTGQEASDRMLSDYEIKLTVDEKTNCWNWVGEFTIHGYPAHWDDITGKNQLVSYLMWRMFKNWNYEDVDDLGMPVLICGNRLCVNPEHQKLVGYEDLDQQPAAKRNKKRVA